VGEKKEIGPRREDTRNRGRDRASGGKFGGRMRRGRSKQSGDLAACSYQTQPSQSKVPRGT